MRTKIIDIVKEIVENLDRNVNPTMWEGSKAFTCNTKWAQVGHFVEVEGNTYTIEDVEHCKSITLNNVPTPGIIKLSQPKFFTGTLIETNNELTDLKSDFDKVPLVYLKQLFDIEDNLQNNSPYLEVGSLELIFLSNVDSKRWVYNLDYYENVIKPTDGLYCELMEAFKKDHRVGKIKKSKKTMRVKYGVYILKGNLEQIFNDSLSGWEVFLELPINKCNKNCCKSF